MPTCHATEKQLNQNNRDSSANRFEACANIIYPTLIRDILKEFAKREIDAISDQMHVYFADVVHVVAHNRCLNYGGKQSWHTKVITMQCSTDNKRDDVFNANNLVC